MPGVKGVTDARPGSQQWDCALDAVRSFGAEFSALMSRGTDIQAIDLSARGHLPYPQIIDRMDRAMVALWRGSDLTTLAKSQATGVSIQEKGIEPDIEVELTEEDIEEDRDPQLEKALEMFQ